jgi:hypothetical protein
LRAAQINRARQRWIEHGIGDPDGSGVSRDDVLAHLREARDPQDLSDAPRAVLVADPGPPRPVDPIERAQSLTEAHRAAERVRNRMREVADEAGCWVATRADLGLPTSGLYDSWRAEMLRRQLRR